MEAAKAGSVELVRAILRKGGNPNALDTNRFSAAHYAAMGNFLEVRSMLPVSIFHFMATKSDGFGSFDVLFSLGDAPAVCLLSKHGCDGHGGLHASPFCCCHRRPELLQIPRTER